ncbi:MAG: hypothetical protein FWE70_03115 [Oscillospiraceae bacterium]|nr:hypothetical protein [Oscillospiraceae bacterium]
MVRSYGEFCGELMKAGFSGAVGGKDDGVFGLFRFGWGADEETGVAWFSGDPDRDPWRWRIRVLAERDDVAYAKVFNRKAGYITKEWYPYFLAARRGGLTFGEEYAKGTLSHLSKRVHDAVAEGGRLTLQDIKRVAGFRREDGPKVEGALTELQMRMFLTICKIGHKVSGKGEEYGFSYTVFGTVESFWGEGLMNEASGIDPAEAAEKIKGRILELNPAADMRKAMRFIRGSS